MNDPSDGREDDEPNAVPGAEDGPAGPEAGPDSEGASGGPVEPGRAAESEPGASGSEAAGSLGDESDTLEIPAEDPAEPETGLIGFLQSRGPQKAVLLLACLVVALIAVVGWFVVARGDSSDEVDATGPSRDTAGPVDEPEAAPEPTTTVPETTTTTLSAEEEAELEVIEAYETALDAIDEASAAPNPDPDHPALEETHTGFGLEAVVVDVEVLVLGGTATRYADDSVRQVEVRSVDFDQQDGITVAYLDVCEITDREEFFVDSGEVITPGDGVRTLERGVEMRQVDGVWKVADLEPQDRQEGVAGCAREG